VRFHTVTSWPAFTRFVAIAWPMIPKPKNATRMPSSPSEKQRNKERFELDMTSAIKVKQSHAQPDLNCMWTVAFG
jgi:hypothetical protein